MYYNYLNSSLVLLSSASAFSLVRLISLYCSACCRDDCSCVSKLSEVPRASSSCLLSRPILWRNSEPASCSRRTTLSCRERGRERGREEHNTSFMHNYVGQAYCLECRVPWVRVPPEAAQEKSLPWVCCVALP